MPRPCLHKSSIVVGVLVGTILVLIMIPGRIVDGTPSTWMTFEHGWPFNYLRRQAKGNAPAPGYFNYYRIRAIDVAERPMWGIPWLTVDNWRFWEAITEVTRNNKRIHFWEFNGIALACDLASALLVLAGVVAMWELRRRRRAGLLSFRVSDMLVAIASTSAVFGWIVHFQREFQQEVRLTERESERVDKGEFFADYWNDCDQVCVAPKWVRSLIGERMLPDFLWRINEIGIYSENGERTALICEDISQFRYLTKISISNETRERFPYSALSATKQLNVLEISYSHGEIDGQDVSELAQLTQLRKLAVDYEEGRLPEVLKRLRAQLPNCKMIDYYDDW
jgi:hypothetical protein